MTIKKILILLENSIAESMSFSKSELCGINVGTEPLVDFKHNTP